jgi:type I restriction enzyme S subunit
MEVRPGYKQTEVGVIPEEWDVKPLGAFLEFRNGVNADKSAYGQGVRFINVLEPITHSHIYGPEISGQVTLPQSVAKRYAVHRGDILFNRTSETQEEIGLAATYLGIELVVFGGFVIRGRPTDQSFDPVYSGYAFRAPVVRAQIVPMGQGAIRANIGQQDLRLVLVPVPPLREQCAIATALKDVDALLGALDRLIAKKRDLRQAAMQQLLTGQTRLQGFHGEWGVKKLGDLFNFSGGFSASRDQLSTEGHCYLHYGDIHGASKTFVDTRADYQDIPKLDIPLSKISQSSMLDDGDVVFVDASEDDEGTSKHVVVVNKDSAPFISGLHTIVAKSKTDELAHDYRHYCFQTRAIREQFLFYAVGTKVSGISKTNIPKLTIPVPSIPEQTAIAAVLAGMDAELATLEERLAKTRDIKQAIMQELLTGETRLVSDEVSHA